MASRFTKAVETTAPATTAPARRKRVLWALPTLVLVLIIGGSLANGIELPAPFFITLVSVVIAATYGGTLAGITAGGLASLLLLHAYLLQAGPAELTGGPIQLAIGTALFTFMGFRMGRNKDASDDRAFEILFANEELKASLLSETKEKNKKTAQVIEREERLRMAVRVSGIGYYKWDSETGNCLFCSRQHAAHFGITQEEFYELNKGRAPYTGNIHDDDKAAVVDAIARIDGGEAVLFEYRAVHPDGTVRFVRQITEPVFDDAGTLIEVVGSSIDLTDLRETEARLRQSQRIEAIGTLTGGVAHDFNNILAIIMGNIELSLECNDDQQRREFLRHALTATNRGAGLTKNLLSFARRAHLEPARLNLNTIVRNTMNWGTRILPESISIKTSLTDGLWDCELDATSLENAIVNLVLNARDAMPDGGAITIETANATIKGDDLSPTAKDVPPGRYVMLAVSDTGCGIDPGTLEKIFEPFHTSKPFGEGSGLGLSMVEGFIKQSGGTVRVHSQLNKGTTFKFYFKASMAGRVEAPPCSTPLSKNTNEGARILVAEDEEGVARVICRTLKDAGYDVALASNGDEGLEFYREHRDFDLILTDVVMPGSLQGPALAKAIREVSPDIPCIFMSGYSAEATVHGKGLSNSDIRLMKPIGRRDLLDAVTTALVPAEDA